MDESPLNIHDSDFILLNGYMYTCSVIGSSDTPRHVKTMLTMFLKQTSVR
jgi:hypothetical protein